MTWRPLRDDSEPGAPIKASLERLVKKLGAPSTDVTAAVFRYWPDAVGNQVAEHSRPIALRDGVLRVVVDDSQWMTQLKWTGSTVMQRLNDQVGEKVVEKLEFRLE
jgi:predicted nucleic acid-binding Zn ribbon protein